MAFQVRAGSPEDAETIVRLIHEAFAEYLGRLDPPSGSHSETVDTVRAHLTNHQGALAKLDGTPIGCVLFKQEGDHIYLGRLAVLPAYRNHGAGAALMAFVEDYARGSNTPKVRLGTRLCLMHLIRYYEMRGYRVVETSAHEGYSQPTAVTLELDLRDKKSL